MCVYIYTHTRTCIYTKVTAVNKIENIDILNAEKKNAYRFKKTETLMTYKYKRKTWI